MISESCYRCKFFYTTQGLISNCITTVQHCKKGSSFDDMCDEYEDRFITYHLQNMTFKELIHCKHHKFYYLKKQVPYLYWRFMWFVYTIRGDKAKKRMFNKQWKEYWADKQNKTKKGRYMV